MMKNLGTAVVVAMLVLGCGSDGGALENLKQAATDMCSCKDKACKKAIKKKFEKSVSEKQMRELSKENAAEWAELNDKMTQCMVGGE